eukprot:TRINITY_DN11508_c0_g1_i1.p3 TRINITY_DN11508_c0_g1~~TRINITY_DN11508_c0_g1_i1.p3  ORF type:complete len:129 (+),score=23.57 TRINITY_DN11508_c0_g1_i1:530-916(+)
MTSASGRPGATQEVARRLEGLITQAVDALRDPQRGVVCVGLLLPLPNPAGAFPHWGPMGRAYNRLVTELVQRRAARGQPLQLVLTNSSGIGCPERDCCGGLHPRRPGYARMAAIWAEALLPHVRRLAG